MSSKRKRRRRLIADRLAAALLGSADGNVEVALCRAEEQRYRHKIRAHFEARRRNYGAAARHRHIAGRLDRAIRLLRAARHGIALSDLLLQEANLFTRRRDAGDLLSRRKGARLRTGRPRSGH